MEPKPEKESEINKGNETQPFFAQKPKEDLFYIPPTENLSLENEPERYTLLRTLGEGGMGTVQLVKDSILRREVALKTIKKESLNLFEVYSKKRNTLMRLKREAEITAILEHPNIIPLYDMQKNKEGDLYFTMRKVEGETFGSILRKKYAGTSTLDQEDLLTIFNKICDALSYAHSKGIIHRDLKPDNIMVGQFGEVYVMDWGIAKDLSEKSEPSKAQEVPTESSVFEDRIQPKTSESNLDDPFKTVGAMGTRGYMSPEQVIDASRVREQADIFALGKILKQCFVYLSPNEELRQQVLLRDQLHQSPENKELLKKFEKPSFPFIPEDIQAILQKATDQEWQKRYNSVKELSNDLDRYRKNLQVSARQYTARQLFEKWLKRNKTKVWTGLSFFGIILLCVIGFWGYLEQKKRYQFEQNLKQAEQEEAKTQHLSDKEKERVLAHLLKALNYTNTALSIRPGDIRAEHVKLHLTQLLVQLACETQNYHFAYYVAREIKNLQRVLPETDLEAHVEREKTKTLKQHQQRLKYWKEALQNPQSGMPDEAILEISKMNEPEILKALLEIVQEGTTYFTASPERNTRKNEYYATIIKALGYLENPKAGEVLWNSLEQIAHKMFHLEATKQPSYIEYMVVLAEALKNSKASGYSIRFIELLDQLGQENLFEKRTKNIPAKLIQIDQMTEKVQPSSAKDYGNRAYLKKEIKDYQGALADYSEAIRHSPQNSMLYSNRGYVKSKLGDLDGAIADYSEAIRLNPLFLNAYKNRGIAWCEKREFEKSIADHTEAIRLDPQNAYSYSNRGVPKFYKGDLEDAIADHTKAIRLNPRCIDAFFNRGVAKEKKGDWEGAIADYTEAIRLNPDARIYTYRGRIKSHKEDWEGAIADYTEAIRLNPQEYNIYNDRGVVKDQKKDFMGAIEDFTEAIRLNPKEMLFYKNRGLSRFRNKNFQGAIGDFTRVIEMNPQSVEAYRERGKANLSARNLEEGIDDLEKARHFSAGQANSEILNAYQQFEKKYLATHLDISLRLFQKRQEINATDRFSQELANAVLNRMIAHYRKKSYESAKADLDLFERYASLDHPKYSQIPQLRASLEKIKPR